MALMMAGLMFGGLMNIFTSDKDLIVSATDLPSEIYGDWYIYGTERYDGGYCVLYGSLYIYNGGNLVLNNLTLAMGNSYDGEYSVYVDAGAVFRIFNSTFKSETGARTYSFDSYGTLQIENSTISEFGINGWWTGVHNYGSGIFKNSTFKNNDIGLDMGNPGGTVEDDVFTDNYYAGLMIQTGTLTARNITIMNNADSGWNGALYAMYGGSAILYDSTITKNSGDGVYIEEGGSVDLYNSTVTGNSPDIGIMCWGTQTVVNVYNSKFGTKTLQDQGGGNNAVLRVYWYVNVSATWQSDGAPVADGTFTINDKNDAQVLTDVLDSEGQKELMFVKEYEEKGNGKTSFTPHKFNVSGDRLGKSRFSALSTDIKKNTDVNVVLDDVPPALTITGPAEGLATNLTSVEVTGITEPQAKAWVDSYISAVDSSGGFTSTVKLDVEGKNNIKVRAQDANGNEITAEVNVTRDTVFPVLTIDTPNDGDLFNVTNILVAGTTEPGVTLSVNSKVIPVGADGKWNTTITFPEGINPITVWSRDAVGNRVTLKINITLDLTAPTLNIGEPLDGFTTKDSSVRVAGITEPKAVVTVNGQIVPLSGSMFTTNVNLVEGKNKITVKSCDKAKNCVSRSINGTRDSIAPILAVSSPPNTDEVLTNLDKFLINGSTEVGAKVTINNKEIDVDTDGKFSWPADLKESDNIFTIVAIDSYGNSASAVRKIRRDSVAPDLTVITPEMNLRTKEKDVEFSGSVEAGAILTINDMRISFSGTTYTKIMPLTKEGANNFTVVAMDKAGNLNVIELVVNRDTMVSLIVLSPEDGVTTTNETVVVEGTTDPKAEVIINDVDLIAGANGKFRLLMNLSLGENTITVQTTDDLGNKASKSMIVVREKKADPPGPVGPGSGGMGLLPLIIIIVVVVAGVGGGVGFYMWKKKKAQPPQQQTEPQPTQGYGQYQGYGGQGYQQPPQQPPNQPYQ